MSRDIKSMYPEEVKELVLEKGLPAFRAKQLYEWIHTRQAAGYEEMTNLPAKLRADLAEEYPLVTAKTVDRQISAIDGTQKYLFEMPDGCLVESVFMRYRFGNSVCISSQVGCRMGCSFCASTLHGLVRSLSASEMLEQIYAIIRETKETVSHVVVMGMGEPLDNYDNLIRFIHLLTGPEGLNLSQRSVTVSTCGIVPNIYRLAEEGFHITLALSLHAATDEQRRQIMPIANRYTIGELMEACGVYYEKTGRQITFEYSLFAGKNDSEAHAKALAKLIYGMLCNVNLIAANEFPGSDYRRSSKDHVRKFQQTLESLGVNATLRREMGTDIMAACGQLRRSVEESKS